MKAIECIGISKRYGGFQSLSDITFSAESGTVTALLGHNGSGKTTILKILAGVMMPSEGSVRISGKDVGVSEIRKEVAFLPQDIELFARLSVKENIEYFLRINGSDGSADELLDLMDLGEHSGKRYSQLSGGLMRRTAVACILTSNPHILLLDEPTAGLDAVSREELWKLLVALKSRGMTIITTVHELSDAQAYSDRIILLRNGRISEAPTGQPIRIRVRGLPEDADLNGFESERDGEITKIHLDSVDSLEVLLHHLNAAGMSASQISVDSDEERML